MPDHHPPPTTDVHDPPADARSGVSRRSFIQTLGLSAAAGALGDRGAAVADSPQDKATALRGPDDFAVTLRVNGRPQQIFIDPATTLLDALRMQMNLTGSKEVCDRGACGGCTVMVDGDVVASCMMLAADAEGRDVTTVEGIANGEQLDAVQEAFIRHDALQCGYCTPGLVVAARALLNEKPKPTLDEIKRGLSGNICRCGTYTNIFNAVLDASGQPPLRDSEVTNHAHH